MGWKRQYVIPLTGLPTTVSTVGRIRYDATALKIYRCNGSNSWTEFVLGSIYIPPIVGGGHLSGSSAFEIHTLYSASGGEATLSDTATIEWSADYIGSIEGGSALFDIVSDGTYELYSADYLPTIEGGSALSAGEALAEYTTNP
jgi:hypothetical protein